MFPTYKPPKFIKRNTNKLLNEDEYTTEADAIGNSGFESSHGRITSELDLPFNSDFESSSIHLATVDALTALIDCGSRYENSGIIACPILSIKRLFFLFPINKDGFKMNKELLFIALAIFMVADLWPVANRYLNKENFV